MGGGDGATMIAPPGMKRVGSAMVVSLRTVLVKRVAEGLASFVRPVIGC